MKYIKLQIKSIIKNRQIINIFDKHNIKLVNNFYVVEEKLFKELKNEILNLNDDLVINRNSEYVIIREKMGRTSPPPKYATIAYVDSKFNLLNNKFDNKFNILNTKLDQFIESMNVFVSEQKQFNKEVRNYMDKHP